MSIYSTHVVLDFFVRKYYLYIFFLLFTLYCSLAGGSRRPELMLLKISEFLFLLPESQGERHEASCVTTVELPRPQLLYSGVAVNTVAEKHIERIFILLNRASILTAVIG